MSTSQTTFYVVAYDISSNRRRTKIHKILSGFGQWTQFSLFECYLTEKEHLTLQAKMEKVVEEKDRIRLYPLCKNCLQKIETTGMALPSEAQVYIV